MAGARLPLGFRIFMKTQRRILANDFVQIIAAFCTLAEQKFVDERCQAG